MRLCRPVRRRRLVHPSDATGRSVDARRAAFRRTGAAGSLFISPDARRRALGSAVSFLRCPVCAGEVQLRGRQLICAGGHRFDIARQGYVDLTTSRAGTGTADSAAMVVARDRFLSRGHYQPVAASVRSQAAQGDHGDELGLIGIDQRKSQPAPGGIQRVVPGPVSPGWDSGWPWSMPPLLRWSPWAPAPPPPHPGDPRRPDPCPGPARPRSRRTCRSGLTGTGSVGNRTRCWTLPSPGPDSTLPAAPAACPGRAPFPHVTPPICSTGVATTPNSMHRGPSHDGRCHRLAFTTTE